MKGALALATATTRAVGEQPLHCAVRAHRSAPSRAEHHSGRPGAGVRARRGERLAPPREWGGRRAGAGVQCARPAPARVRRWRGRWRWRRTEARTPPRHRARRGERLDLRRRRLRRAVLLEVDSLVARCCWPSKGGSHLRAIDGRGRSAAPGPIGAAWRSAYRARRASGQALLDRRAPAWAGGRAAVSAAEPTMLRGSATASRVPPRRGRGTYRARARPEAAESPRGAARPGGTRTPPKSPPAQRSYT